MKVIRYTDGYKYQADEDYTQETGIVPRAAGGNRFTHIDAGGKLTIFAGYAWNGANKPAINDRSFVRPSGTHDALYQLIRLGVLQPSDRAAADALLGVMLREDMLAIAATKPLAVRWAVRALAVARPIWVVAGVRLLGGRYAQPGEVRVLSAPVDLAQAQGGES